MAKAINDDISIKGSTLVIGVKFPPVDDIYTFTSLLNADNIKVYYYIINCKEKHEVTELYKVLDEEDSNYDNMYAFTVDTNDLIPGVLMVEVKATIPAHDKLPQRIEIARCSSGIAIVE
jgi:hypothetical protein